MKHEHCFTMEKYGLDRHTASAYLIALKHLQDEDREQSQNM